MQMLNPLQINDLRIWGFEKEYGGEENEEELRQAIEKLLDNDTMRKKMGLKSKEIIKEYNVDRG